MRRILVTGGTGYLGSTLVPLLAQHWPVRVLCTMDFGNAIDGTPNVEFIKGDINDETTLDRAMEGCTDVCHLAAIVTDELVDMNSIYGQKVNVQGTRNVLKAIAKHGIQCLVYASSGSVYGTQEQICTEITEPKPITVYAKTKLEAERMCLAEHSSQLSVTALRMATCCGPAPRMRFDTIVNIFCKQAFFDGKITVFDGRQSRSNVHVKDAAKAYLVSLLQPGNPKPRLFNVVRDEIKAIEIALLVLREAYNRNIPCQEIKVDVSKVDTRFYRLNGDHIKNTLGWSPQRTIVSAIQENFDWFATGNVKDPNASVYYNNRHMPHIVAAGSR